jgi:hypothetical protein
VSDKKQYINVITNANQLKVDYQVLDDNGNILSNEKSIFLQTQEYLSEDAVFKITSLEQNIPSTYISTLLYNDTQKILLNNDPSIEHFSCASLNDTQSIVCDKNVLFEIEHYFNRCGIDYIFSPFHILYLHSIQTSTNRLNILILENKIYFMIIDDDNKVIFSLLKNMTSFEDIKNSSFYEDEIDRQKLFDEINFLETQKYITEAIEQFYQDHKVFLTDIDILYTLKQLNNDHIQKLEQSYEMTINYRQISIDESLYDLAMHYSNQSFTKKREVIPQVKKSSNITIIAVISSIIAIALVYFLSLQNKPIKTQKQPIKIEKTIKADLPNHINLNNEIFWHIKALFDTIPYSMVIDEVTIKKDSSIINAVLLDKSIYLTQIQPQLLKIYASSKIKYSDETKQTLVDVVVTNELLKKQLNIKKVKTPEYIIDEFIPQQQIIEQIKILLPKNSIVTYKTKYVAKFTTFNFMISSVVNSPKEFFDIIKNLNNELYSLHINYPVNMRKTPEGIEVNFLLQFHQY